MINKFIEQALFLLKPSAMLVQKEEARAVFMKIFVQFSYNKKNLRWLKDKKFLLRIAVRTQLPGFKISDT